MGAKHLGAYVRLYFESAFDQPQFYDEISNHKTMEKGHGRIEKRYYYLSEEIDCRKRLNSQA